MDREEEVREHLQGKVGFGKDWQEVPAKPRLAIPYSDNGLSVQGFLAA